MFLKNHANRALTAEEKEKVLEMTLNGHSMITISKALDIHRAAIYCELERDPDFLQEFNKLRDLANDELLDSLLTITETVTDKIGVLKARLKAQNILAIVEKRNPKKYSPKLSVEHQVTVDLSSLLKAADNRVQLPEPRQVIDVKKVDDAVESPAKGLEEFL